MSPSFPITGQKTALGIEPDQGARRASLHLRERPAAPCGGLSAYGLHLFAEMRTMPDEEPSKESAD